MSLQIIPVHISKDILPRDDLIELLLETRTGRGLKEGDILVFTQKIISKQEGRKMDRSFLLSAGFHVRLSDRNH